MDYNNYFAPAPHTYGYLGFGSDSNVLGNAGNSDSNHAIQVRKPVRSREAKQGL